MLSTLDAKLAFWQIEFHKPDGKKTGLFNNMVCIDWKMPCIVKKAIEIFQRAVHIICVFLQLQRFQYLKPKRISWKTLVKAKATNHMFKPMVSTSVNPFWLGIEPFLVLMSLFILKFHSLLLSIAINTLNIVRFSTLAPYTLCCWIVEGSSIDPSIR